MKNKINLAAILLVLTSALFIAGIFLIGFQARQQIQNTRRNLDTFMEQVADRQQELSDAQSSFSRAIKEKKDLLNYQQQKASGRQAVMQEHRDTLETDNTNATSVFSQDHD